MKNVPVDTIKEVIQDDEIHFILTFYLTPSTPDDETPAQDSKYIKITLQGRAVCTELLTRNV